MADDLRIYLRVNNDDGSKSDEYKDITSICSGVKMSGSVKAAARTLSVESLRKNMDYYLSRTTVKRGDGIMLKSKKLDDPVFVGMVWDVTCDDSNVLMTLNCYDSIKFLMTSKAITDVFVDKTAQEITETVCKELGVTPGTFPESDIKVKVNARGRSGYDVIMIAWTETKKKTGSFYYPRMVGFKLCVIEKGELLEDKVLTYRSEAVPCALTNVRTTEDSSTAITAIFKRDESGKTTFESSDKELINKYGYIVGIKDAKQSTDQDDAVEINEGKKTCSVEAIGDWEIQTGWSVRVSSEILQADKLYIENDTHEYYNGIHTMQLDLSYENSMDEMSGDEFEKKGGGSFGHGTNEEQIYNFLRANGFSAAAACGAIGNMMVESGCIPDKNEYGYHWYGKGYGLVQWTNLDQNAGPCGGARRTRLENWCAENGYDVKTLEGQLNYLLYEYEECYEYRMPNYRNQTSPEAAASEWLAVFEGVPHHSTEGQRQQYAREYYDRWKDYDQIPIDDYGEYGEWDGELSASQQELIDIALRTPGPPAEWCASWVSQVFGQIGISLIGNGVDMTRQWCPYYDLSALVPGMLIGVESTPYGNWGASCGHIAIYIGNDTVLSPEGGTVKHYSVADFCEVYQSSPVRCGWAGGVELY